MKLLVTSALIFCALFLNAQIENGCISIDFETIADETPFSGLILSDQFKEEFGLSFRLEGGGFPVLAQVGGDDAEAFGSAWGNDTPNPSVDIGEFFLTDDGQLSGLTSPPIILDFEIPIDSFAGCILDMDFSESFVIQALDQSGAVILEEVIEAGDPGTGDGALTCWGFNLPGCEGSIYSIKYAGFRPESSPGAFGLGMDFFSFCYSGLQIDTETNPVTCDGLGSASIFSTTSEVYEYSIDGINYSLNGFFDQLDQGILTIYVRDNENCISTVDVNIELNSEDLPDPIFVNEEICEGETFSFNGQDYTTAGMFQQTLIADSGCDTIWNLNLTVNFNSIEIINAEICNGETFELNGQSYSTEGTFMQQLNTVADCDSIIELNLIVNSGSDEIIFAQICDGETFDLNGDILDSTGLYTQQITNELGCDSLIILNLEVLPNTINTIFEEICEGDDITINGVLYNSPGVFTQSLSNSDGCDSIIDITIGFLSAIEMCQNVTIFEGEEFTLNGISYTAEGTFQQMFQTVDGCDSLIIIKLDVEPLPVALIHYDLDNCAAGGSSYDEFVPRYDEKIDCAEITASILNRPSGLVHSCTPGEVGSGMCISSDPSCIYEESSEHQMVFDVFINPNSGPVALSGLRFFEKAPINYQFNSGGTGLNNYPTLYSISIVKDSAVIFFDESISTNREWTQQTFNFSGLDQFIFDEPCNIQVQFLAYCPIGISSNVTAWDIDELSLFGHCQPDNNKVIGNVLTTRAEPLSDVSIAVNKNDEQWEYYSSDNNGDFTFQTPYNLNSVLIEPDNNIEPLNGVTTLDMILIQRHILGLQTLDKFTNLVAADINKDNKITVSDLLDLRKVLLGIHESFPKNTSWRFLDAQSNYTLLSDVQDRMFINTEDAKVNLEAVKVGDINQSYNLNIDSNKIESRQNSTFKLITEEYQNSKDELSISFLASEDFDLAGIQAAFNVGNNTKLKVIPRKLNITQENFHLKNNTLNLTWSNHNVDIKKDDVLFEILFEECQNKNFINFNSNAHNEIYQTSDLSIHTLVLDTKIQNININNDDSIQLTVYPNPFSDGAKLQISSEENFTTKYELIDASGRLIKSKSVSLESGVNEIQLNHSDFPGTGVYFIRIHQNQSVFIKRIVLL